MSRPPNTPLPNTPSGAPNPFAATPLPPESVPSPTRPKLAPVPPTHLDTSLLRIGLRDAARKCSERGLYNGAKWALQQLTNLPVDPLDDTSDFELQKRAREREAPLSEAEDDACNLAVQYFRLNEHRRAEWCLRKYTNPKAIFLRCYCMFLLGERRKAENALGFEVSLQSQRKPNPELRNVLVLLNENESNMDSFCWYMKGLVFLQLKLNEQACEAFIKSIERFQYNWSAWEGLGAAVDSSSILNTVLAKVPPGYMCKFFSVYMMSEKGISSTEYAQSMADLAAMFPDNPYLTLQSAVAYYNQGKYRQALDDFEDYREREPYSLENTDTQSHILFTLNQHEKLSVLAHEAVELDRFKPETCITLGNYYSSRRDHYHALQYFERATKLRPGFAEAFILMGDEYLELKNSNAALETYRRAADAAPHDFRTWFGIAKAFDLLDMPDHSLPYYQKAVACRPYQAQIWTSMGVCYEKVGKEQLAMMCYQRGLTCMDKDTILYFRIAKLYDHSPRLRDKAQAAVFYKLWVEEFEAKNGDKEMYYELWEEAHTFLTMFFKDKGKYAEAEVFLQEILHTERGKALLRELRALKENRDPGGRHGRSKLGASNFSANILDQFNDHTPGGGPSTFRMATPQGTTHHPPNSTRRGYGYFASGPPGSNQRAGSAGASRTGSRNTSGLSTPAGEDAR
ncbi:Anaphase-promoting complex subunit 23 [Gaertneriomyces sp. JEL0708]|nr:Anaphase-promoting complex subunit 23 [Gaertneriomyces sp. JEL0708]